ncbi:unnamed protein product [Danaus chrysippus]|uniref:(African queen) hypothetical protein n=1 Tax=Danaus chrysippus TaxID=151541 RepID=A0A8J2QN61_9NEOP|nr:unnamed protein product [Danaus chrysippus]
MVRATCHALNSTLKMNLRVPGRAQCESLHPFYLRRPFLETEYKTPSYFTDCAAERFSPVAAPGVAGRGVRGSGVRGGRDALPPGHRANGGPMAGGGPDRPTRAQSRLNRDP